MPDTSGIDNPFSNGSTAETEQGLGPSVGAEDDMGWQDLPEAMQGDTSFVHAVHDIVGSEWRPRWYKDARTWRQRVQRMDDNWRPLIPDLVEAYIAWCYPFVQPPDAHAPPSPYNFDINVIDFHSLASSVTISRTKDSKSVAQALVLNGYLRMTPLSPSLAISFKTLEILQCLRLFKASFSIEAFAKLLCHYYKLDGEPDRRWDHMFCMDGNNSLKRIAQVGNCSRGDIRVYTDSDYYLPLEFVDKYVDEVPSRIRSSSSGDKDDQSDYDEDFDADEDGAKYPLATVAKALEVLGDKLLAGYDIGCAFEGTIQRSSLGSEWTQRKCHCCVNAFHGYSHNYPCQLTNHPNVIEGMGLEDLETMERIFSGSNNLALITRYASAFRHHVFIDTYFQQWDTKKYTNLSMMLYNNYVQALKIINAETPALEEALQSLQITHKDLAKWSQEEREYFRTLGREQEWDIHAIILASLRQSVHMGIANRWQLTDTQYIATLKYMLTRKYLRALDNLQQLVVQRLFELYKLNLSHTAYRVRTHTAKSLQVRRKVIRNAVKVYNAAANALQPLHPTLDWTKVSHYSFIDEFHILKDTRDDVRKRPWSRPAVPAVRETMKQARRIAQAHVEVERCNIEARRLHTLIRDKECMLDTVLEKLHEEHALIHGAVADFCQRRRNVNARHLACLQQLYALDRFTGELSPGQQEGVTAVGSSPSVVTDFCMHEGDEAEVDEDDDELQGDIGGLVDYMCNLSM
ncbi:hypothetical protein SCP_1403720 [Sparassis crispa]|uniref:CxC1-like cysteine cluster associated with KDZ transposases domain-containing protein n=1 Tax=Sparassis crispa TaxID=139825 RepID=A0A401H3H6_9APHY|nr:hypothetical protein SCP_1403720 [Sparassis crispa]GBE88964.1 hypothetical protein SCP_1403720 [Sparassis crispa]